MSEQAWGELNTNVAGLPAAAPTGTNGAGHQASPRPLPYGVADYFWNEAAQRKELEIRLYALFQRWGYSLVIPPTFEYAETFYARADADFQTEMYRFPDKDGTMLALRPEMTIPVARLAATRLHDVSPPQRYCYMGSVFRYIEPRAGRQREFFQAGIELIGAPSPEADAEVVALTAAAVEAAEIDAYQLVLGQLDFFHGLLQDLALSPPLAEQLRRAIDRNSEPQLHEFLAQTALRPAQRTALEAIAELRGDDVHTVIEHAERHCLNARMRAALATLRSICQVVDGYQLLDRVYLDLTEINNLGYYTGLSFEVLTPRTGFSLGGGGRYDTLLASFGHDKPAVGAALGIDRLLHARQLQQASAARRAPAGAQIEVNTAGDPACLRHIQAWRGAGLSVALHLEPTVSMPTDGTKPQATNAPVNARWTGSGFDITWYTPESTVLQQRSVPVSELPELTATLVSEFNARATGGSEETNA